MESKEYLGHTPPSPITSTPSQDEATELQLCSKGLGDNLYFGKIIQGTFLFLMHSFNQERDRWIFQFSQGAEAKSLTCTYHILGIREIWGRYTDMVSYIKYAILIRLVEETVEHKENWWR